MINTEPIYVDFNSRDEDDGVWLSSTKVLEEIKKNNIDLKEGNLIWLTDGELEIIGKLTYRIDRWVAVPDIKKFVFVDEKASYHYKNWTHGK